MSYVRKIRRVAFPVTLVGVLAGLVAVTSAPAANAAGSSQEVVSIVRYDGPPGAGGVPVRSAELSAPVTGPDAIHQDPSTLPTAPLPQGQAAYDGGPVASPEPTTASPAAYGNPGVTISQCQASNDTYSDAGFVIDHFNFCQGAWFTATYQVCDAFGCSETGSASWRQTTIGHGYNGSRHVDFSHVLDDWQITGDAGAHTMKLNMNCLIAAGASCAASDPGGITDTFNGWASLSASYFRFDSSATGGVGTDLISLNNFQTTLTLEDGTSSAMGQNQFRCDSATYLASGSGCVFNRVVELFTLSVNSNAQQEALHIYQAQNHPESTVPTATNKSIPGGLSSGRPLSRAYYDGALRDANNAAAVKTCQSYFPAYNTDPSLQCDEYPFASTYQGAANGPSGYSARPIPGPDNASGGGQLAGFYTYDRIIDRDDSYYVVITS